MLAQTIFIHALSMERCWHGRRLCELVSDISHLLPPEEAFEDTARYVWGGVALEFFLFNDGAVWQNTRKGRTIDVRRIADLPPIESIHWGGGNFVLAITEQGGLWLLPGPAGVFSIPKSANSCERDVGSSDRPLFQAPPSPKAPQRIGGPQRDWRWPPVSRVVVTTRAIVAESRSGGLWMCRQCAERSPAWSSPTVLNDKMGLCFPLRSLLHVNGRFVVLDARGHLWSFVLDESNTSNLVYHQATSAVWGAMRSVSTHGASMTAIDMQGLSWTWMMYNCPPKGQPSVVGAGELEVASSGTCGSPAFGRPFCLSRGRRGGGDTMPHEDQYPAQSNQRGWTPSAPSSPIVVGSDSLGETV